MLRRERVQEWFDSNWGVQVCALDYLFTEGFSTGKTIKHLRNRHSFPFKRDDLEIWKRWYGKENNLKVTPPASKYTKKPEDFWYQNDYDSYVEGEENKYQKFWESIKDDADEIQEKAVRGLIRNDPVVQEELTRRIFKELEQTPPKQPEGPFSSAADPLGPAVGENVKLYVILPDQQIPYHDRPLHELILRWLEFNKPDGKVYSGDLIDLPGVSRYDWNPDMDPDPIRSTMQAVEATRQVLGEYKQAAGPGDDWLIEGNHEYRLFKFLVSRAPELFYLQEADGEQTLDLYRILGLKSFGVKLVPGRWPQGKLWLSPKLGIIHGRLARQGSGVTARATLKALGHSVIMAHTHRQAMVFETQHPYGGSETRVAVEAGTLARLEGGLGYSPEPDWQQGGAVVRLFPDGTFHVSLMTYTKGALYYEDQVYRSTARGVSISV